MARDQPWISALTQNIVCFVGNEASVRDSPVKTVTETGYREAEIEPLHPALGARITGVDLREPVGDELTLHLRHCLARYAVLCFPQKNIEADHQAAFAAIFGRVDRADGMTDDPDSKQSVPGVKYISNIRENGEPIGALPDGEMHFHSDGSHRAMPYRATTLYAIEVPDQGGETRFASMASAFEALPDDLQARLDGLSARHVFNYNKTTREEMRLGDDVAHAIHPLIRRHPDTGRKSLYLSRLMTRNIEGMDDTEGEALLLSLLDHCERPDFVYEHAWQPGDLVIWDNRSVNHARNDFPADQRRLLRRYTVSESD